MEFLRLFAVGAVAAATACSGEIGGKTLILPQGLNEIGWTEIAAGGATMCALGDPYSFFVAKGSVNRILLDFQGGGACWDDFTCGFAPATNDICTKNMDWYREAESKGFVPEGIYDRSRSDNPFKDWYHVVVPYCTCDVHWGNNVGAYQSSGSVFALEHRGAVNARAVLDWVYRNFSAPEMIFITGCSSGALGSIWWTPDVVEHYPDAEVVQFGDSGAGVITDDFFAKALAAWRFDRTVAPWVSALDPGQVDVSKLRLDDVYVAIANQYPDVRFSQYNSAYDEVQTFYFVVMGGNDANEWSQLMQASVASITARTNNFASYLAPGSKHCIIPWTDFYQLSVHGRQVVDWLRDLRDLGNIEQVACVETECQAVP